MDTTGAQWILTPEPIIHRRSAQVEKQPSTRIFTTRCQHVRIDAPPLYQVEEPCQPAGWCKATDTRTTQPGGRTPPLYGGGIGMAILQHRRRTQPRCSTGWDWRRSDI